MITFLITLTILIIYSYLTSFKFKYEKFYDETHLNILLKIRIFKSKFHKNGIVHNVKPYELILPKIYFSVNLSYLGTITIEINNKNYQNQISYQD